jgi:hypothetical protein
VRRAIIGSIRTMTTMVTTIVVIIRRTPMAIRLITGALAETTIRLRDSRVTSTRIRLTSPTIQTARGVTTLIETGKSESPIARYRLIVVGLTTMEQSLLKIVKRWRRYQLTGSRVSSMHVYEVRPRKDHRSVDLISHVLPFGRLWYEQAPDAIDYAKSYSRSHHAVIRVYDEGGNVIEMHEHAGESSTYTRLGSTLTISGERDAPRWL